MKNGAWSSCPFAQERIWSLGVEELATLTLLLKVLKLRKYFLIKQKKRDVLSPASWFLKSPSNLWFYQKRPKRSSGWPNKKQDEGARDNYLRCLYFGKNHNKNNDWRRFFPRKQSFKRELPIVQYPGITQRVFPKLKILMAQHDGEDVKHLSTFKQK